MSPDWSPSCIFPFAGTQHRSYRGPYGHPGRPGHRLGCSRVAPLRGEKEETDRRDVQTQCWGAVRCKQRGHTRCAKVTEGGKTHLRFCALCLRTQAANVCMAAFLCGEADQWKKNLPTFKRDCQVRGTITWCIYLLLSLQRALSGSCVALWRKAPGCVDLVDFKEQLNISRRFWTFFSAQMKQYFITINNFSLEMFFSCFSSLIYHLPCTCTWFDSVYYEILSLAKSIPIFYLKLWESWWVHCILNWDRCFVA